MSKPRIVSFAAAMVQAMKANQEEKGDSWEEMSTSALLNKITKNLRAVRGKLQWIKEDFSGTVMVEGFYSPKEKAEAHRLVQKHLVDIGNYAMMLFSRFDG